MKTQKSIIIRKLIQALTVFFDIAKVSDFRWKNVVSRTQAVFYMIYKFVGLILGRV